jgi:hypothetical protein
MPPARPTAGSLFAIGDDYLALLNLFDELEDDPSRAPGELEPAMEALFAEIGTAQAEKLDGYANVIRHLETRAAVAKEEAERYRMAAQVSERRAAFLKNRLLEHLARTNQPKVMTATGRTISVVANGGALPVVIDEDVNPETLPEQFRKVAVTVDTAAVRKALAEGHTLDFAHAEPRGHHLRIK